MRVPTCPRQSLLRQQLEKSRQRARMMQDNVHDGERDLSYRGTRIQTLADLLVYAQVDTRIWEVERHVINKYEGRGQDVGRHDDHDAVSDQGVAEKAVAEEKLQI